MRFVRQLGRQSVRQSSHYEKALLEFESMPAHDTSALMPQALLGKASILESLGDTKNALLALDELASRFNGAGDPAIIGAVATALFEKGAILSLLRRFDEAATAFNSVAARCKGLDSPAMAKLVDTALLNRALVEGAAGNPGRAVETATKVLDRDPRPDTRKRARALFMRAFWRLKDNGEPDAKRDIAEALELLPECDTDLGKGIDWLMRFAVDLGCSVVLNLVKRSTANDLLLPLATALEQELGREPRVAIEVLEVANDIRRNLQKLREDQNADRNLPLA
ncbi:MAG: hypothetical protein OXH99_25160 [Bryobacterales bacterium]|nr:hypothetical protein [Bryobacterales bacterium]